MIDNKCPSCGSTNWLFDKDYASDYNGSDYKISSICFCEDCKIRFVRYEHYTLTEATNKIINRKE